MSDPQPRGGLGSLPRNVWVVTLTSFLTDVSTEMLASFFPLFASQVLGAGTAAIGLIEGVAEATASLLKLGSGWLSDRVGRRKSLAVAGYALSAAAKPFLFLVGTWTGLLAVRFVERVGKGVRGAPRDALLADGTDPSQRGLAFGVHRAGDTAGAVVGLVVALAVVWSSDENGRVLTRPVFRTLVVLCLAPASAAVVILAAGAREVRPAVFAKPPPRLSLRPFDSRFKVFLAVTLIFALGNSSDAFLILRAQRAGLSVAGVIGMMIGFNVVYALAAAPAGALSDRLGRRRVIVGGWLLYALIYVGFARVGSGTQAWLLMSVYGLYYAATEGAARAYVADLVPPEHRGTAYGLFHATVGIAALPASLLAGILWQGVGSWPGLGESAPFLFGACMALVSASLLALCMPPGGPPVREATSH